MSITLPESVPIPKASLLEILGRGLGGGIQSGIQQATPMLLSAILNRGALLQKRQEEVNKFKEQSPLLFDRFAKQYFTKEQLDVLTPEKRREIQEEAIKNYEGGLDPASAFNDAFLKSMQPPEVEEDKKRFSTLKGGLLDLLRGKAEERPVETLEEKPKAIPREILAGLISSLEPFQKATNPIQALMEQFAPQQLPELSDLIGISKEKLTPEQIAATEQLRLAGSLLPDIALAFTPAGEAGRAEKSIEKLIKPRVAKEAEEVATKAIKPSVIPKSAEATRVEKAAASKLFKTPEEIALREEQLKNFPKFAKEIEADAAKRLNQSLKIKRAETLAKEENRMALAAREVEPLRNLVQKQSASVKALENEVSKLSGFRKSQAESMLEFNKMELRKAQEELDKALSLAKTGKVKATTKELEEAALKRLDKLRDQANDATKPIALSKSDYNSQRVSEFKKLVDKKAIPGKAVDDLHQKIMKTYEDMYSKRLNEMTNEIASATKRRSIPELMTLKRERDALKKMLDNVKANRFFHERTQKLRQIEQQQKISNMLKKAKQIEKPQVTKLAKGKITEATNTFIKNPNPENLEILAKSSGQSKESIVTAKNQTDKFSKNLEEIKKTKKVADESKASYSKRQMERIKKDVKDFLNEFKKSKAKSLVDTPIGRSILGNLILSTVEAVAGRKLPYGYTYLSLGLGRGYSQRLVSLLFRTLVSPTIRTAKKEIDIKRFKEALKSGDTKKIIELREKIPAKYREEASKRMRSG